MTAYLKVKHDGRWGGKQISNLHPEDKGESGTSCDEGPYLVFSMLATAVPRS
jgi:hypothetical protein